MALAVVGVSAPAAGARVAPAAVTAPVWSNTYSGLDQPTNISTTPRLANYLFVTEKTGTIKRLVVNAQGTVALAGTYLDISPRVESNGEAGLLSMVFSPHFAKDGFIFLTYSDLAHDLVLARARALDRQGHVAPLATRINPASLRTILVVSHRDHDNHWGGSLAFGPDGNLYLGTGDGGGSGDSTDSARKLNVLRGKVLRLNVLRSCGGRNYCIPTMNPFTARKAPLVWLFGLRNPWKMNFDPATKKLWIGDVGQDSYEEVDVVPTQPAARDLGWPCREGFHSYDPSRCAKHAYFVPAFEIAHPAAEALTGGLIVPSAYASLAGLYVSGDYVTGLVWWFNPQTKQLTSQQLVASNSGGPVAFAADSHGVVWTVTYSGAVWRLTVPVATP